MTRCTCDDCQRSYGPRGGRHEGYETPARSAPPPPYRDPRLTREGMLALGYVEVARGDVPDGSTCSSCRHPARDPDLFRQSGAVRGPDGRLFCGWTCACSAERTRRYRAWEAQHRAWEASR